MGSTGTELAADCVDLWKAGEYELKPLVAHYRQVIDLIAGAESGMSHLWRHESLGGSFGPVRDVWERVAEVAIQALRESAENLDATADVLTMASEEYLVTDAVAAREFEKLKSAAVAGRAGGEQPR
ncbi:hypothetical protein Ait01nite_006860 [Actinoplanes italicus]|uniref:Excreted virulence factor EspC (Type VII ESX diderm) n=1 Tax=Actinoplanes italicus TaxID=113567 RepID=A0A2T0KLX5_9ACTN|nr:hypothetical protein [Actinoplanes italicus]PRX24630.1 hypothetical protein CLV67_102407 [Actinoplanes italicus]GIE27641.1 hypothetical protein Ait01nite_006860 [Actinoplanes italicus]